MPLRIVQFNQSMDRYLVGIRECLLLTRQSASFNWSPMTYTIELISLSIISWLFSERMARVYGALPEYNFTFLLVQGIHAANSIMSRYD